MTRKELNRQAWANEPRCQAISPKGRPCSRAATHPDPNTNPPPPPSTPDNPYIPKPGNPKNKYCFYHAKSEEDQKRLYDQAKQIRKQSQLKPHELMRVVIESNPVAFMQPYLDALGIRIVFVPDPSDPLVMRPTAVVDPNSLGTTLYGISKDGQVIVSRHKDIEAQQRAAERLFDRVYGKPKQTNIIAGAASQDDPLIVPFDQQRQAEVAAILEAAQRPAHKGGGLDTRSNPTAPEPPPNSQN